MADSKVKLCRNNSADYLLSKQSKVLVDCRSSMPKTFTKSRFQCIIVGFVVVVIIIVVVLLLYVTDRPPDTTRVRGS